MLLLKEIHENEVITDGEGYNESQFKVRKAARGVIFNSENKIALLYVSKFNYYKLPGGGIDPGEDTTIAFTREVLEETGAEAEVLREVGVTIEYKNKMKKLQISYCYIGKVVNDTGEPQFSQKEKDEGFTIKWVGFSEAENLLNNQNPSDYSGRFITIRDSLILKTVRLMLTKK